MQNDGYTISIMIELVSPYKSFHVEKHSYLGHNQTVMKADYE